MKKFILNKLLTLCSLLFALCILPISLLASDSAKIGIIDIQKIADESEAGKKAVADLTALYKSKQSAAIEKRKAIEKLREELKKQETILTAEARKSKIEEIEKMERGLEHFAQDSEIELRKKDVEIHQIVLQEILEVTQKIGVEEGYTLILDKGSTPYADKAIDITDKILKKYNESKAEQKKQ
jgi:outer membrane protein